MDGIHPGWFRQTLYTLDGHRPVPADGVVAWAHWFEEAEQNGARIVAHDHIGGTLLSTVFIGLDHNFTGIGRPILFETALLSPDGTVTILERYRTWDEASLSHREHRARVTAQLATAPE